MYLDSKTDDSFAPRREQIKIVIEAGRRVRPVLNASSLVTCCKNTGIIKRSLPGGFVV
jgi:hypothetical protein